MKHDQNLPSELIDHINVINKNDITDIKQKLVILVLSTVVGFIASSLTESLVKKVIMKTNH